MKKGFNDFHLEKDYVIIHIKDYKIKISKNDLDLVSKYRWFISSKPLYPYTDIWNKETKKRKRIRLHDLIIGEKLNLIVDHIDGDIFNNSRENLRLVTYSVNNKNKINGKGYSLLKYNSKTCRTRKPFLVQHYLSDGSKITKKFKTEREAIMFKVELEEKRDGFSRYKKLYKQYFKD